MDKKEALRQAGLNQAAKLKAIRQAIANYMRSEGCSCCENEIPHNEAKRELAGLLDVPMYSDGSGYDFNRFCY